MNESDGSGTNYAPGPLETELLPSWSNWNDLTEAESPMKFGANLNCVRHPILPLTSTLDSVSSKIDALTSHQNLGTILAPGIVWGQRVLYQQAHFTEGGARMSGV